MKALPTGPLTPRATRWIRARMIVVALVLLVGFGAVAWRATQLQVRESPKLRALADAVGVEFYDPAAAACDERGCLAALDGEPLLWDGGHFTAAGSAFYGAGIAQRLAGP